MKEHILNIFSDRMEIPLYYVESGSRLWGMASPDSDYDVRGIHLLSKQQYFDFKKHQNVIDGTKGNFDLVSFDLDKAFGLLAKSNPNVLEWIRADTVYFNRLPEWDQFRRQIIDNINYKALYYHYLSMARNNIQLLEKDKKFTYKIVLYCSRGLLSADLALQHILPELEIDALLKQFEKGNPLIEITQNNLIEKRKGSEQSKLASRDKENVLHSLLTYKVNLEAQQPEPSNNKHVLIEILRQASFEIKSKWYGK